MDKLINSNMRNSIIFGFDSAWTNKNRGAICAVSFDKSNKTAFHGPEEASFEEAATFISSCACGFSLVVVAIDQPTIVLNETGCRPVDRIAASLISYIGGGVQPANRSKCAMFGPEAPIWRFKSVLNAKDDPDAARNSPEGQFLIEVFPALALTAWNPLFAQRLGAPKYNPANKRRFKLDDWRAVNLSVEATATTLFLPDVAAWAKTSSEIDVPRKADQDKLDSVICVLAGLIWRAADPSESLLLGNVENGLIVTPVSTETRGRLERALTRGFPRGYGSHSGTR